MNTEKTIRESDLVKFNERARSAQSLFFDWYEDIPGEINAQTFLVVSAEKDKNGQIDHIVAYNSETTEVEKLYPEDVEKISMESSND